MKHGTTNLYKTSLQWFKLIFFFSLIILAWAASIYLVRNSDILKVKDQNLLSTLLFGSASVALFIVTIITGILAVVGWQSVQGAVSRTAREVAEEAVAPLKYELQGRVLSALGYLLGEMNVPRGSFKPANKEKLSEVISLCQQGYESLRKVGGSAEFMALNNLVYYSCIDGDKSRRRVLLEQARRLRDAGQEHGATHLLLTSGLAFLWYGTDAKEVREMREILLALSENPKINEEQKKEAKLYLTSFPEA